MKVGQVITQWWQDYVAGRLRSPQDIVRAAINEKRDPAQASDRFLAMPGPSIKWDAPERLRAPAFMRSNAFLRQWDRADWQQVDPRLMKWAAMFIEEARKRGIPIYAHTAFRTEAEQAELVRTGRSKAAYPRSAHNNGEAVDVVHGVFHWDLTKEEWALLHVLGLRVLDRLNATLKKADKLELVWGGHWRFYDPAHWEIAGYRDRIRLRETLPPVRMTPRGILRVV